MRILWLTEDPRGLGVGVGELEDGECEIVFETEVQQAVHRLAAGSFHLLVSDAPLLERDTVGMAALRIAASEASRVGVEQGERFRVHIVDELTGPEEVASLVTRLVAAPGEHPAAGDPGQDGSVLQVTFRQANDAVLRHLAESPEALAAMHWRDFEHLVAELFERKGFTVTLTSGSRDRGADLYVAQHSSIGSLLYVVECKRYRRDRPIGPGLVRQLRGVVDREGANAGLLVTTSFFTSGAYEEQRAMPFRLSLRDNDDLRAWLRDGLSP